MDENRKGPGVFYAVVGVATLVVAIIGATFAYFTATDTNNNVITGTAATAGVTLKVTKVSTEANGPLVPIADGTVTVPGFTTNLLDKAIKGDAATNSKICVDKDGNTVCQLYKFTVKNDGNATAYFDGTMELTATGYQHLKWANINSTGGASSEATPTSVGNVLKESSETEVISNERYDGGITKHYFVLIYIKETGESQNTTDTGNFTGVVTFQSAGGHGATASFSA